jgi:hypothetical protein
LGAPQGRRFTRAIGKGGCGLWAKIGSTVPEVGLSGAVPMQSRFVARSVVVIGQRGRVEGEKEGRT